MVARILLIVLFFLIAPAVSAQDTANLRSIASQVGIPFGTTATSWQIINVDDYGPAAAEHFNHLASDWELHWGIDKNLTFRPDRETYNWVWLDAMLDFAQTNSMTFEGHHLLWGNKSSLPAWLLEGQFSKDELLLIMQEHIESVVGRYKGKVTVWTVVNEPFGFPWDENGAFWHEQLGPNTNWIDQAFIWADSADPNAVLILNDAGMEFPIPDNQFFPPERYDDIFNLASGMKQRGIPIDGIGFQMHLNAQDFTDDVLDKRMQDLAENINRYRQAGLDVYITELDIRINEIPGTDDERYATQSKIYRQIVKTALTSGVRQITTFGLSDEHSWYEADYPTADATLLSGYQPKPAYTGVIEGIRDFYQTLGDSNRDLLINGIDYITWCINYQKENPQGPQEADFNSDTKVDGLDYITWLLNYQSI